MIRLRHFLLAVQLAAETLRQFQPLYLTGITLAQLYSLRLGNLMAIVDDLVQQFGIGGECHVLLLYGRVDVCCLLLVALAFAAVLPVRPFLLSRTLM